MKRSLLVAALATLGTTAAFAQSSVTIYGRLNTSVERQEVGGVKDNVVANNGSRLGFKGLEELGGGLKAGFTLEHRFDSDDGESTNGNAFWGGAGESSVYLIGGWGMVKAGLSTAESYFATSDMTDLMNHGTGTSADALYRSNWQVANKVSYRTPTFGEGTWAEFAALEGNGSEDPGYDVAVNSTIGALGLGFGYERQPNSNAGLAVRASYDLSPFLITGYVQRYDVDSTDDSTTVWRVAGMYTVGNAELVAAYGSFGEYDDDGVTAGAARTVGDTTQYTVGVNYNLSKRTKVYTYYNRVKEDSIDATTALAVGIRHNF
jgi:predicted porin